MKGRLPILVVLAFVLSAGGAFAGGAAASNAAATSLPRFPGLMAIPVPKQYGYGGFFARQREVKIVFGVSDPDRQLGETLTNAAFVIRDLKSRGVAYRIQIVLYGNAVKAADTFGQRYAGEEPLLKALAGQGVAFRVCYNSLMSLHMDPGNVYGFMKIVPAGVLQIVKKEIQGYAYISNR